jgi:hypothetical protein
LITDLDRWSFLLKNLGHLKKIPVSLMQGIFKRLFTITEVANLKKEQYMLYQRDLKAKWNEYANLTTARNEGLREVVKNLILANRFTIAEIANFASVTEDFVEKVKKTLN